MKAKKLLSILLAVTMLLSATIFAVPANAAQTDCVADTSSFKAYDKYLQKLMDMIDIKGVSYVTQNGHVIAQHARGMKNTKENQPLTIDTLFPIGSVSKQFCAVAVLLLQEQGKLSVDDTLSMYFPEYEIGKDITIHQLLCMRSGIRDHVNYDEEYVDSMIPSEEYTVSDKATYKENQKIITDWLFTQRLKFAPGTQHSYSNANFLLLSMIVEQVSGVKYSEFVKENIFKPLNMTNSGFYEELVESPDLAENALQEGQLPFDAYHHGVSSGAGDIVSNTEDIDKWLTSLYNRTLLSEESYKAMTTDYGYDYGYGIQSNEKEGHIFHQGNIATYESFVLAYPEKNLNIFVVTSNVAPVYENGYTMMSVAFTIANKVNGKAKLGDVDSDNEVSILDATAIQMHFAQLKSLTSKQLKYADTDGDGEVSVLDATEIQLVLANK